jgi:hypothetical protein
MTDTPTPTAEGPDDAVAVDVQEIIGAYEQELADQVRRRIMAEASAASLRRERTELRATIAALQPTDPTVQENSP